MNILITGGAGFIGSSVIRQLIENTDHNVLNLDKLTYAGNLNTLNNIISSPRYNFVRADICDKEKLNKVFETFRPNIVMNLAAETHVDQSISNPVKFIETNIMGTFQLLEVSLSFYKKLNNKEKIKFRFHHISTDEVYGDLGHTKELFTESTPYAPSSPYSSSKASSDHLVRAWHRTYGLPIVLTNCSNNYGPFQNPEKLIPLIIVNALAEKPLPIYGKGKQIRDWLFVEDHASALIKVATKAPVGEFYNIGGNSEKQNIEVVLTICDILDELCEKKNKSIKHYKDLIKFVKDRPGHDFRYAIDATKISNDLGWKPKETFKTGIRKTVKWFIENN